MNTRYIFIIFIVVTIFPLASLTAQSEFDIQSDSLPLDNSIKYGRLPNGLNYYIKSLVEPQSKLYLKLIIKAGGNQEDTDQLNISHALEHMAFRSSKNFPLGLPNDKERIDKLKIRNYKDFRGGNSAYFTQYIFDAPINDPYAIETCLLWFKDIANGLNLTDVDIDKERGALRQEFILRNGSNLSKFFTKLRLCSKIYPCKLDYTNFFAHNKAFQPEILRRYYQDWYRPDLMAISIVGNIENLDDMERQIKETFSYIPSRKNPRNWKDCDSIYFNRAPQFVIEERIPDPLKSVVNETVEFLLSFRDRKTKEKIHALEGVKRVMTWRILTEVLRTRFNNLGNVYNSNFRIGGVYSYSYTSGDPLAFNVNITSENHREKKALKEALQILRQIQKYGLLKEEWEKIRKKWLHSKDDVNIGNANYWHEGILKHFVFGETLPANKEAHLKQWLSKLSVKEYNKLLRELISDMPEDIGIIAPTGHKALSYTEKEVHSWIKQVYRTSVEPYTLPEIPQALISKKELTKLKDKKYKDNGTGNSGARELILDNGVKIILMPYKPSSGLNKNKIMLHGFSAKGAYCFPKEDYFSAINAPGIVQNTGVGNLDKFKLNRFLSKKGFWQGVHPYIDFRETGIKGEATVDDLESMLQLVYLYYTKPRKDKEAFEDWKMREYKAYQDPSYGLVSVDFDNSIKEIIGDSTLLFPMGTKHFKGMQITDLESGYDIYQKLFGNAKDFTFLISGDYATDSVLPMVQKYLGNLPNLSNSPSCNHQTNTEIYLKKGPMLEKIPTPHYGMKNVSYAIKFNQNSKVPFDWRENIKVQVLGGITNEQIWTLRYDKGFALYDINVFGKYNYDMSRYQISLKLDCEAEELVKIQKECKRIISDIKSGFINNELFKLNLRRVQAIHSANRFGENEQVQKRLYEYYKYGSPWPSPLEAESFIKSITVQDITETAKKYYRNENLFEFVMGN